MPSDSIDGLGIHLKDLVVGQGLWLRDILSIGLEEGGVRWS